MSRYIILVETGADIPYDFIEKYQIQTVPMDVMLGMTVRKDSQLSPKEVFDYYVHTKTLPTMAGCCPDDYKRIFQSIHVRWPEKNILHLSYSSEECSAYRNALLAAGDLDYVISIDTKLVSAGQAAVALSVAQYLEA